MPNLDGTGPEGKGGKTGRKLGNCVETDQSTLLERLGTGLGLKRRVGGGNGKGKRIRSRKDQ
jgi:hypothetical protein